MEQYIDTIFRNNGLHEAYTKEIKMGKTGVISMTTAWNYLQKKEPKIMYMDFNYEEIP